MRRVIVMIALVICVFSIKAQTINVNPDPNGEPWWTGPDPVITTEVQARIDAIQDMELTDESINTQLNSVVDNSTNLYFRPVFNQMGASCAKQPVLVIPLPMS